MLAIRVIPCLDIKDGRVVKGVNFKNLADAGDPLELAKFYNRESADELIFLDIGATNENRETVIDLARRLAENLFIPFTIGGGIASVNQATNIVMSGADKIAINSAAVKDPGLISACAERLGSQCVVLAVDVKTIDERPLVHTQAGRHNTGIDALDWVKEGCERGAGEILLTSMDTDGTKQGFDAGITRKISEAVSVPVIASGGGGMPSHFSDVVLHGKADAVLGAGIFHFKEYSVLDVKRHMIANNIPVRMPD